MKCREICPQNDAAVGAPGAKRIVEGTLAAENVAAHDQFTDISKKVRVGSGALREVPDVRLTRYACYLVAMSCDGCRLPSW